MSETRPVSIANVQALRGCAALLVAFGHGARAGSAPDQVLAFLSWFAYAGVDIFFVISGFIVSEAATRAAEIPLRACASLNFAVRRVFRIFPLYWVALPTAMALGGWIRIAPAGWPRSSVMSMTFLTTIWITPLSAAWSLAFEVYFYVALAVIILIAGRRVHFGIFVWFVLQTVWISLGPSNPWSVYSNELVYEFAFGWLVGCLRNRGNNTTASLSAIGALAIWIAGAWLTEHRGLLMARPRVETFGIASALLLYALLRLEVSGWRAPKLLQRLGDISYSIYLWHMILFGIIYAIFPVNGWTFAAAMALTIGWSFISHALIEKTGIALGKKLFFAH